MSDLPVAGPLGELHLGHEARLDPVGAFRERAGRRRVERRGIAAKRGQALIWVKVSDTATVGTPHPPERHAAFTVRLLPGAKWMRRA